MKNTFYLLALLVLATSTWNCAGMKHTRQLNAHQQRLATAATSNQSPEKKLDILMESLVDMMDESLSIVNPIKGAKYVERYGDANLKSINTILAQGEKWRNNMNTLQSISFGANMLQKPYSKKAIDLIPKFEKKYRQVKFVAGVTGKVRKVFLKI